MKLGFDQSISWNREDPADKLQFSRGNTADVVRPYEPFPGIWHCSRVTAMTKNKIAKNDSHEKQLSRFLMCFVELRLFGRLKVQSFDLCIRDSFDRCESVNEGDDRISQNLKSILMVDLWGMYLPPMGLFGEVNGNDHASSHLDIQSLIEPETIRLRQ
jgi:hypothetical protein